MSSSTIRIAWRNLGRNRKRTVLAVAAIALGQFTLVFVNCMMAGMFEDMLQTITGPLIGHVQIHNAAWRDERAVDLYVDRLSEVTSQIRALAGVKSTSPRVYAGVLVAPGAQSGQPANAEAGMIVGIDVGVETDEGGILEGLSPDRLPGTGAVVVGKVLANRMGLQPGDSIAVIGQDADEFPTSDLFEIRAVVRSMTDVVNRLGVVMSLPDAGAFLAMPDRAHEIVVQGTDLRQAGQLAGMIAALPALAGAEVLPWREAAPELVTIIDMKDWMDLFFVSILFVAAAAGIVNTMMMSSFERRHEFGMLLAMGSGPGRIVRMVLIESIILGLVGVILGSILGGGLVLLTAHTGIDYSVMVEGGGELDFAFKGLNISYMIFPRFEWRHVGFGVVAVTVTAVLAALWPAALIARLQPVEAMRS